jgi:hypothetical protein
MIVQGIQFHDLRADLVGYTIIAVVALALIAMAPTPHEHPSPARLAVAREISRPAS